MDATCIRTLPEVIRFEVPSRPKMISYIRTKVAEFASSLHFSTEDVQDIQLAVGEASANAVKHATTSDECCVSVSMERLAAGIRVCISDLGDGFDLAKVCATPECLAESGRGIMFMRTLMDKVTFHFNNPGTCVEMFKRFHSLQPIDKS